MSAAAARSKSTNMRWYLAIIMFTISFVSYMDRVNLSVAVPMISIGPVTNWSQVGEVMTADATRYCACSARRRNRGVSR